MPEKSRAFVIVPRKPLVIPKPVKPAHEEVTAGHEDFLKEDPGEAIEVGGYHFVRPQGEHFRHSRPTFSFGSKDIKGQLSENKGVVAIYTHRGVFVGSPRRGFKDAAAKVGVH